MSGETIFDWAERMVSMHNWEEHETAAWVTNRGGARGGPSLSFSMVVDAAPCPPSTNVIFEHCWWKWKVKATYGDAKYKVIGYETSMDLGKSACEYAVLRLIAGFRVVPPEGFPRGGK